MKNRSPEATSRSLANGASIETIIDQVLKISCRMNLSHELDEYKSVNEFACKHK